MEEAWAEDQVEEQTTGAMLPGPTRNQGTKGSRLTAGRWAPSYSFMHGMHIPNGASCARSLLVFPGTSGASLGEVRLGPVFCCHRLAAPHAHDHQILTNIQAGSEQTVRQERGCTSYLAVIKQS